MTKRSTDTDEWEEHFWSAFHTQSLTKTHIT